MQRTPANGAKLIGSSEMGRLTQPSWKFSTNLSGRQVVIRESRTLACEAKLLKLAWKNNLENFNKAKKGDFILLR